MICLTKVKWFALQQSGENGGENHKSTWMKNFNSSLLGRTDRSGLTYTEQLNLRKVKWPFFLKN